MTFFGGKSVSHNEFLEYNGSYPLYVAGFNKKNCCGGYFVPFFKFKGTLTSNYTMIKLKPVKQNSTNLGKGGCVQTMYVHIFSYIGFL